MSEQYSVANVVEKYREISRLDALIEPMFCNTCKTVKKVYKRNLAKYRNTHYSKLYCEKCGEVTYHANLEEMVVYIPETDENINPEEELSS